MHILCDSITTYDYPSSLNQAVPFVVYALKIA